MQLEPQINQTVVSQFKFGTVKVPSRLTVFHINPLVDYTVYTQDIFRILILAIYAHLYFNMVWGTHRRRIE